MASNVSLPCGNGAPPDGARATGGVLNSDKEDPHNTTELEKVPTAGMLSLNFFDSVKEEINALAQEPEFIDVEMMTKT